MKLLIPALCALLMGCAPVERIGMSDSYTPCPEYCGKCYQLNSYGSTVQDRCYESCEICSIRRVLPDSPARNESEESTFLPISDNFELSAEVESFLREAMPMVAKGRAVLLRKYAKMRKVYNDLDSIKANTYSDSSKEICENKQKSIFSASTNLAEKLRELNTDVEKLYVKYKTTYDENDNIDEMLDEIDKISAKISKINEEIRLK